MTRLPKYAAPAKLKKLDESEPFRPWCAHVITRLAVYHSTSSNDRQISFHVDPVDEKSLATTNDQSLLPSIKAHSFQVAPPSSAVHQLQ
jgi:hypothetical protein